MNKVLRKFLVENERVLGQLLFGFAILIWNPQISLGEPNIAALTLRKLALVMIGGSGAHLSWKNLMSYLDTRVLLEEGKGLEYIGASIFRGLYYLAWILGVSLGF